MNLASSATPAGSGNPRLAALLPTGVFLLLYWLLSRNDLDGRMSAYYFDSTNQRWPLMDSFWTAKVLHEWGADLIFVIGVGTLLTAIASRYVERLRDYGRGAVYVALAIGLSTGIVALTKDFSNAPCPWNAVRFGGSIPHVGLFEATPAGTAAGHCFPAAHASSGFALMSFYYALRERRPRWAWVAMGLGCAVGVLFSWTQVARGAHFPSHNVASALIVWTVCTLLYWLPPFRGRVSSVSRPLSTG